VHGPKPPGQWRRTLAWSKPLKAACLWVLFRAHAGRAYFNVSTNGAGGEGCELRRAVNVDRLRSVCFGHARNQDPHDNERQEGMRRRERRTAAREEQSSGGRNPMSGSGMK